MQRLKDNVIIVTGGSGLLGRAFVKKIKEEGGNAINADVSCKTDLQNATIYCDVRDDLSIKKSIQEVLDSYGKIDGLVNNAYPRTKDWGTNIEAINMDSWRKNVDWQLNSYVSFSLEVLKYMKIQRTGSIVNIASIYGVIGNDFTIYEGTNMDAPGAYAAVKGALINFTRYLASYYGKYGIRVNSISPGGIFDHQTPKFVHNYEKKVPLKRMGRAEDIAPSVCFLLSDEASYVSGHNLIVDGGWTAI